MKRYKYLYIQGYKKLLTNPESYYGSVLVYDKFLINSRIDKVNESHEFRFTVNVVGKKKNHFANLYIDCKSFNLKYYLNRDKDLDIIITNRSSTKFIKMRILMFNHMLSLCEYKELYDKYDLLDRI